MNESESNEENQATEIDELQLKLSNLDQIEDPSEKIKAQKWNLQKKLLSLKTQKKFDSDELKPLDGIIFTVGFSPEPIIHSILNFKPEFVFFIATENTEKYLDQITEECSLKPSCFKRRIIKRKDDPADAYEAVKEGYHYLVYTKNLQKDNIALDPTGGTKMMSVGCGIFTSTRDINVVYVTSTKYDAKSRRPVLGSEEILMVNNPMKIYYDQSILEGLEFINNGNYAAAFAKMTEAHENGKNPVKTEILKYWTLALKQWDSLSYKNAHSQMQHVLELIEKYDDFTLLKEFAKNSRKFLEVIKTKLEDSGREVSKFTLELIYDLYLNATRSFNFEHYDTAALKFYRIMEMVNQYILWQKFEFDTSEPDFSDPLKSKEQIDEIYHNILELVEEIQKKEKNDNNGSLGSVTKNKSVENLLALYFRLFHIWKDNKKDENEKNSPSSDLNVILSNIDSLKFPRQIALFNGILMRRALGLLDCTLDDLIQIDNAIRERNKSVLAHGVNPIAKDQAEVLQKVCNGFLNDLLEFDHTGKFKKYKILKKEPKGLKKLADPFNSKKIKNLAEKIREKI